MLGVFGGAAAAAGGLNAALDGGSYTVGNNTIDPDPCTASVTVNQSGVLQFSGTTDPGDKDWLLGGDPTDYEVRATNISGTVDSGTVGSYLDLNVSSRTWSETLASTGTETCTIELTIRNKTFTSQSITFQVTLNCLVDPPA